MCDDITSPLEGSLTVEPERTDAGSRPTLRVVRDREGLLLGGCLQIFSYRAPRGFVQLGRATDEQPHGDLQPTAIRFATLDR